MIISNILPKLFTFWVICSMLSIGFAQNDPLAGRDSLVLTNERILESIDKDKPIQNTPSQEVNPPETTDLDYYSRDFYVDTDFQTQPPQAKPFQSETAANVKEGFIKLGIGRFLTPLFEAKWNQTRNASLDYGIDFRHFSAHNDKVELRRFRENEGSIHGRYFTDQNIISGRIHVFSTTYFNFADTIPRVTEAAREEDLRMTYSNVDIEAEIESTPGLDLPVTYQAGIQLQVYNDRRTNEEFHIRGTPKLAFSLSSESSIRLATEFTYANARIADIRQNRGFISLAPSFNYQTDLLNVKAGFRFDYYNNDIDIDSETNIAPQIEVSYALFNDDLVIVVGADGGIDYNPYNEMIRQNPYLATDITILPSIENWNIYGGIQGNLTDIFDYSARVYYKRVEQALIYTIPFDGFLFDASYDSLAQIFGIYAEINYDLNSDIRAGAAATINIYDTETFEKYFHATPIRIDAYGEYLWNQKLVAKVELNAYGPTKVTVDGDGELIERDPFVNLNISGDYRITNSFSVFARVHNLFSGNFERWHNYVERPIDFSAGITFVF